MKRRFTRTQAAPGTTVPPSPAAPAKLKQGTFCRCGHLAADHQGPVVCCTAWTPHAPRGICPCDQPWGAG